MLQCPRNQTKPSKRAASSIWQMLACSMLSVAAAWTPIPPTRLAFASMERQASRNSAATAVGCGIFPLRTVKEIGRAELVSRKLQDSGTILPSVASLSLVRGQGEDANMSSHVESSDNFLLRTEDLVETSETSPRFWPSYRKGPFRGRSCRVAVIGAGAAGLVAARELLREGHQVVIYERGEEVGGVLLYDPRVESDPLGVDPNRTRVHSSMYSSLRTNLPREIMGYLDYPFLPKASEGRDTRRFPRHEEVAHYLKDFSEDYNLVGLIKFGAKVEYVGPEAFNEGMDMRWVVKIRKFGGSKVEKSEKMEDLQQLDHELEVFDAVVVCNGHYAESRVVQIPGVESWPGVQMHSHNYRFPHPFQDQIVVVIGSANSAQDITREVALSAKEVHQCARAWTSTELLAAPKGQQSNIWQHPMVECAKADKTVKFKDGTATMADVILHCTGYLYSFPFLDTEGYVTVDDNRVGPLYKHVFPPALAPTLSFVGLPWKVVPFPLMELQSKWIARLLSGKASLPSESEMLANISDFYEQLEAQQQPKSYTHNCGPYQYEYVDWLAEQSGHEPVETWRKEIYVTTSKNRHGNPDTYRDEWQDQQLLEDAIACLEKIKAP